MGDPRGFLKVERVEERRASPSTSASATGARSSSPAADADVRAQASRCMDCGIPFCHQGCPLGNLIPEWNDLVYAGRIDDAARAPRRRRTTSPRSPAACARRRARRRACSTLDDAPVTIKTIERTIADARLRGGRLVPAAARPRRTGKRVAVVGSGPAGLAAAQQLARAGHDVVVFERDDRVGGLLRYGIPDFKMEKGILDRARRADARRGRALPTSASTSGRTSRTAAPRAIRRDRARDRRARAARSRRPRARARRRALRDGLPRRSRTAASRATTVDAEGGPSSRRASTSSSSAAATPAPTASAPRFARAPRASRSSS